MSEQPKSLKDIQNTSIQMEVEQEESIIPTIDKDGNIIDVEESERIEREYRESIQETQMSFQEVQDKTGIDLDFSEMFQRSVDNIKDVQNELIEQEQSAIEEQEADNLMGEMFEDEDSEIINLEREEELDIEDDLEISSEEELDIIDEIDFENDIDNTDDGEEEVIEQPEVELTTPSPIPEKIDEDLTDTNKDDLVLSEEELDDLGIEEDAIIMEENEETEEQANKRLEKEIKDVNSRLTELLNPVQKAFNDKVVTLSKRPVSVNAIMNRSKNRERVYEAEWVLMNKGKKITMSSLNANDIIALDISSSSKNKTQALFDAFRVLYDHITSEKPKSFEQWLKTELFEDINHYYMAAYRASFEHANHIPNFCESCNHLFLTEDIKIMDMVEYRTDEAKKRFNDILEFGDTLSTDPLYETKIVPIGADIAVGLKQTTIYSYIFEQVLMEDKVSDSKKSLLSLVAYIDNFYFISNNEYHPINLKEYPNNPQKTAKYKVAAVSKILDTLSSDEYSKLITYVENIREKEVSVTYSYPGIPCPRCGEEVKTRYNSALNLLFRRHQLVNSVNI